MRIESIYFGQTKTRVTHAVLHWSATPPGTFDGKTGEQIRDTIRAWHLQRGFSDIGYHYIIDRNGNVYPGRPLNIMGAHALGVNQTSIGILLIEKASEHKPGQFGDYFTEKQRQAVTELARLHGLTRITGHNEHVATLCPGFRVVQDDFIPHALPCWQKISAILKKARKKDGTPLVPSE